ncbi:MAG TPA: Ig-like domain-containing protein [Pyrinomonadaceae bacterium]|nr:Ig-like domain-containing protein [Pyrinomonadaceae bacterium]
MWKFDGQTLQDASGNGNHGSFVGGAGYSNDTSDADASLAGFWKFDEGAGATTADATGKGNNGTVSGASWSAGRAGAGALNFDGVNDYVQIGTQPLLAVSDTLAVSSWIYPTGPGSNATYGGIIVNKEGEYEVLRFPDGTIRWAFANSSPGWVIVNTDYVAPPNQWTHVAVTYDRGLTKTYANGALVHTYAGTGSIGDIAPTENDFRIGGRQTDFTHYFQGRLDDVRVYRRYLTGGEIQSLFNSYPPASNQPPTVSIASPANNATFVNDSNINLTAAATDADGTVSKVEFFRDATKLGEDTSAPYECLWSNALAGNYSLTAKAIDNHGAITTSSIVNVIVTPPVVTVSATDANASEPGLDTGTFNVNRTGGTSAPLTVTYAVAGTATNGTDYGMLGGSLTIPSGSASQTVTVVPSDDAALEGSESVTLTPSNNAAYSVGSPAGATVTIADNETNPPTVSLTSPGIGAVFNAAATITINATAADSDGTISKVEFFQGTTKLWEDTTAPYSYTWSDVSAGSYSLTAVATDNAGATGASSAVSIIVNAPPTVSVTSPTNGKTFAAPTNVTVAANVMDSDGSISKVEFFRGSTKLGEDTSAPYSYTLSNVSAGSYALTALATDNHGLSATSAAVNISVVDFTSARLDAANRTGSTDLFSRNFYWSLPLVSLPGRTGLDLELSLSYNSLVWTRAASSVIFDADHGFPTPGFRLGFPVIEGPYLRSSGDNSYILITSSGARVELRQQGASNLYESSDSSFLQMEDSGGLKYLRTPDGTRLAYNLIGGQYQCTGIKDRNGNYISIVYNSFGRLAAVLDTLGRTINVNYDEHQNPISITQAWTVDGQPQTHVWATFGYENRTINTAFANLSVFGAVSGRQVPVLSQVGLDDGSRVTFSYGSRGQVEQITRAAQDASSQWVQLNYTAYTFAPGDTDCPRFTERREWAKDWNIVGGVETPAVTTLSVEGDMQVVTAPNGTQNKVRYAATGWQRGLVLGTETWATVDGINARRRWTTTEWTQDDTTLTSQLNPRPVDSTVNDSENNRRRTTIEYLPQADSPFRLPKKVSEFRGYETAPLRYTELDYELGEAYTSRRVIGLVKEQRLFDGQGNLQSKVSYEYDAGGDFLVEQTPAQEGSIVQHDAAYNQSFVQGRGLVSRVRRWDVDDADNAAKVTEQKSVHNTTGSLVASLDALNNKTTFVYADHFDDSVNRRTLAYPTAIADAAQNLLPEAQRKSFSLTYEFDTGRVVRTRDVKGAEQTFTFDRAGRLTRSARRDGLNNTEKGYTRWIYAPAQDYLEAFTSNDSGVEGYRVQVLDGAGRTRAAAGYLPGSVGGYSGQHTLFDNTGRVIKQSLPTEMSGMWIPTGDDEDGWLYTRQAYDWRDRPTVTANTDETNREMTYGGCGCAGGEVVTTRDEVGRRQTAYADTLGRWIKTEILNPDGGVYRTITNEYNGRDQIIRTFDRQGTDGPGQETLFTYDGHGRLKTSKSPIQTTPDTYLYNADDTLQKLTDARGVSITYSYNNQGMLKRRDYSVPSGLSGAVSTSPVEFEYDEAGNRLWMTDELGRVDYEYDTLSQLRAERRTFNDANNSSISNLTRSITYDYSPSGALKSVTDPFGDRIDYVYNQAGQLQSVSGSPYNTGGINGMPVVPVSQYATNLQYRAWGALKSLDYGNQIKLALNYDIRRQLQQFKVYGTTPHAYDPPNTPTVGMHSESQYFADGMLRYVSDKLQNRFDRAFQYDGQLGNLTEAYTGTEARDFLSGVTSGVADGPFRQSYQHDVWGNTLARVNRFWSQPDTFSATYSNNRRQDPAWQYDASGQNTRNNSLQMSYDAEQRNRTAMSVDASHTITQYFDGDGHVVKRVESESGAPTETAYYLHSSILGGRVLTELDAHGAKVKSNIYAGQTLLAEQWAYGVVWKHVNPLTGQRGESTREGYFDVEEVEPDTLGVNVGKSDPYITLHEPPSENGMAGILVGGGTGKCKVEGLAFDCAIAAELQESGSAVMIPEGDNGDYSGVRTQGGRIEIFQPFAGGHSGFLPPGSRYIGGGIASTPAQQVKGGGRSSNPYPPGAMVTSLDMRHYLLDFTRGSFFQKARLAPQTARNWTRVPEDIRCAPTGEELASSSIVRQALLRAWADANIGTPQRHEEGGWIYFNPATGKLSVRRAPAGQTHSLDLRNPPDVRGSLVAGTFHIHPEPATSTGYWESGPSPTDKSNAYKWGVPGVVMSQLDGKTGIQFHGPKRLGSHPDLAKPIGQANGFLGSSMDTRTLCP